MKEEINEIKKTAQDLKDEINKNTKYQKKNQTEILEIKNSSSQIKTAVENHASGLEQVEDRISRLKEKTNINKKT
jgi:predicted  nucleic acid-binding Zn-ribbon protein